MRGVVNGEKCNRECPVCSENQTCNFCKWRPIDMKNHKHTVEVDYHG